MSYPIVEEYQELSRDYKIVPVYRELLADMETPISVFKKVCDKGNGYLLESVEGGENLARYSFIGTQPMLNFTFTNGKGTIEKNDGTTEVQGNPVEILEGIMNEYKGPKIEGLPRFYGGAVGFFGFDTIGYIEELPSKAAVDVKVPDCQFIVTRVIIIFDHLRHRLQLVINTEPGKDPNSAYRKALAELDYLENQIIRKNVASFVRILEKANSDIKYESNMTKEAFIQMVEKGKEYIKKGDIFQVVLSQRFTTGFRGDPFDAYRSLRTINPAPYLYYLNFGDIKVIGSSPEMLVRVEDSLVQTRPIAGTRPRNIDKEQDIANEKELLADEKEKAEHIMLVDLGRNDLGRVCKYGTVQVSELMHIERYSHVMHMVSNVTGTLAEGKNIFDVLKASFPAGTVSGAPKIRAMEIIDELEPVRRGLYAGVIGYFGFAGNMDTCITIRTIVVVNHQAYVQAGGGIVADSIPEKEYEESMNKAKAMLETLKLQEV